MASSEPLDHAFTRATGAALVAGNEVLILKDARENYPAWLAAIESAERTILIENYMFCDDEIGARFARALAAKSRAGLQVRVLYDWLGSFARAPARYWSVLRAAGAEVRCFNPPRLSAPLSALHRDHRKMLAVDARVGFVSGLCIGRMWTGNPARGIAPWRDTGVQIRGPALSDIERAFAQGWAAAGPALAPAELSVRTALPVAGSIGVRIVASSPGLSGVLRLDQLIAVAARRSLWLTDAYFAGIPPYVQALCAAARDGVDVRMLVPGASDIALLRPLSQAGYRPLLEAGVRVFEWKGSMLHAKTAVADGRWARVGSSNLNIVSWIANLELDALIEDEEFAARMEEMYLEDLGNAVEIVLRRRRSFAATSRRMRSRVRLGHAKTGSPPPAQAGSASRAAAGALRIGRTVGAALSEQRVLAATEARLVAGFAFAMAAAAAAVLFWPQLAAIPAALLLGWAALTLLAKALALRRERREQGLPAMRLARTRGAPSVSGDHSEPPPPPPSARNS